eukprot:m.32852 g.32852  ORF g.32852 m.32852 type:complete len:396 (+) comp10174_c0_seq1:46-1233(+)
MPPKKSAAASEDKPRLGRFGTSLKIGIVGLPNVGKSTLFNVLTKSEIPAENYPFCTKDPNEARVPVPDTRFDWLVDHHKPASAVPAFLNVVDIAGLVKGAHEGQGLGNAFLANISACDAIFHVTRAFGDAEVIHVEGEVNPVRDLDIISSELRLKDMEFVRAQMETRERILKHNNDKKAKAELAMLTKFYEHLEAGKNIRDGAWDNAEIEVLNGILLLTAKPVIYLVNLSEPDYIRKKNRWLAKIKAWVDEHEATSIIIPFSASLETTLVQLPDDLARLAYLEESKCQSALPKIITTGFSALSLQYFFTAGPDEVKAWTLQKGTKAPQAAGKIHGDFEKGFIMAEVMAFDDYKELGTEAAVKSAGKYRQQGKQYVVLDGDIIFFKFNAGAGLKKK